MTSQRDIRRSGAWMIQRNGLQMSFTGSDIARQAIWFGI